MTTLSLTSDTWVQIANTGDNVFLQNQGNSPIILSLSDDIPLNLLDNEILYSYFPNKHYDYPIPNNLYVISLNGSSKLYYKSVSPQIKKSFDFNISSGNSISDSVNLGNFRGNYIIIPNVFEAENISFLASYDDINYYSLYDSTNIEYTFQVAAQRIYFLDKNIFGNFNFLKIRSGTASNPVILSSNRTIKIIGTQEIK